MYYSEQICPKKEGGSWNRPRVPGFVVGLALAVKDWDTTQLVLGPEAPLRWSPVRFSQPLTTQAQFKSIVTSYQPCISRVLSGLEVGKVSKPED